MRSTLPETCDVMVSYQWPQRRDHLDNVQHLPVASATPTSIIQFHIKYFENGHRYNDPVNGSSMGNNPWAINWHHKL